MYSFSDYSPALGHYLLYYFYFAVLTNTPYIVVPLLLRVVTV